MNLQFSDQAKKALQIMEHSSKNLFLTGKAGTGKSTLLQHFREHTNKKTAILAPTGVAAINVKGETIHSFFKLKPGFEIDEAIHKSKNRDPKLYKNLQTIIIDEISMVRPDILDAIDIFLRQILKKPQPFAGIQMIFIGDLYQLPPVVTRDEKQNFFNNYDSTFFFSAQVFKTNFQLEFIELQKIYRQEEPKFIEILNAIRNKTVTQEQIDHLNQRVKPIPHSAENYIHLTTTNKTASRINQKHLSNIFEDEIYFDAKVTGDIDTKQLPTDQELTLKIGAQIMFVVNDNNRQWVNGTIGTIIDIDPDLDIVTIETIEGKEVEVTMHTWEISKYVFENGEFKRKIIGTYTQIPVKLAWAITIHKSQGKTFHKVIIDLGKGSFTHGQTYVALSRCTSLNGILLKQPITEKDLILNYQVQKFLTNYQYQISEKKLPLQQKIDLLNKHIRQSQSLKITYLKKLNEKTTREIIPQSVEEMQYKGFTFLGLRAFCLTQQSEITFSVKKILEIHPASDT